MAGLSNKSSFLAQALSATKLVNVILVCCLSLTKVFNKRIFEALVGNSVKNTSEGSNEVQGCGFLG
jgi:hypothetical protein